MMRTLVWTTTVAFLAFAPLPPAKAAEAGPASARPDNFKIIHTFGEADDLRDPYGAAVDASGALYSIGVRLDNEAVIIFRLVPPAAPGAGWTYEKISELPGFSLSPVAVSPSGKTVYSSRAGGLRTSDYGEVYKLVKSAQGWTFRTVFKFDAGPCGTVPNYNLVVAKNGDIFGSTQHGEGNTGVGVVFKIDRAGTCTKLASLPIGGGVPLLLGKDGAVYYAVNQSVFRVTPSGQSMALPASLDSDYTASGTMTLGDDGAFYGTSYHQDARGRVDRFIVWSLSPTSNAGWSYRQIYLLEGSKQTPALVKNDTKLWGIEFGILEGRLFDLSPPPPGSSTWSFRSDHLFPPGSAPFSLIKTAGALLGFTFGDPQNKAATAFTYALGGSPSAPRR